VQHLKDQIDRQSCDNYDIILELIKSYRDKGLWISPGRVKKITGIDKAPQILTHLESNGFLISYPHEVTGLEYTLTPAGLTLLHKTGGYYQYLYDGIEEQTAEQEKRNLELRKLKHDVSISKWQYRFFLAGATAGILNLIWTVVKQFIHQ
jgi:hypothetical protein